jgi:hypothetical protein
MLDDGKTVMELKIHNASTVTTIQEELVEDGKDLYDRLADPKVRSVIKVTGALANKARGVKRSAV